MPGNSRGYGSTRERRRERRPSEKCRASLTDAQARPGRGAHPTPPTQARTRTHKNAGCPAATAPLRPPHGRLGADLSHVFCTIETYFFCESSLLRINQRHHSLETRPWHTPPAAVRKPTEESTRERGLGVGLGRDSRYGSIYVCPPPPRDPRALVLPPSSLPLPFSPRDPTPSTRPTGRWRGT